MEDDNAKQKTTDKGRSLYVKDVIISFILLLLLLSGAYIGTEITKQQDYLSLERRIDALFKGQDEICDYSKTGVKGRSIEKYKLYGNLHYRDENGKTLEEGFARTSGGWNVIILTKLIDGFKSESCTAKDMGFKVPEKEWEEGTDYGFYKSPGQWRDTYRGSVQNAYDGAMNYLTVGKGESYKAGSFSQLQNFGRMRSNMHEINESSERTYLSNSYIYNDDWIVWYDEETTYYKIVLDKGAYYEKLAIYTSVAFLVFILVLGLWKFGKYPLKF